MLSPSLKHCENLIYMVIINKKCTNILYSCLKATFLINELIVFQNLIDLLFLLYHTVCNYINNSS